jgi:hypothetical protein
MGQMLLSAAFDVKSDKSSTDLTRPAQNNYLKSKAADKSVRPTRWHGQYIHRLLYSSVLYQQLNSQGARS